MNQIEIEKLLQGVFHKVFDNPDLCVSPQTTASDVTGWDSLTHINLIVAIEKAFKVRFTTAEVSGMQKVGDLLVLIERKTGK